MTDQNRKDCVVNAAWEVFARFGYQKASMQDIASSAQVSKSVLFKYYQTKENLYRSVFRLAADAIAEVDAEAKAERIEHENVFSAMRKTVNARMRLFSRAPYVYQFSYYAAYDTAPLVQQLVLEEFTRRGVTSTNSSGYNGIRSDVSPQKAKQMIFWISQGFLGEQLAHGMTEPETLKKEYLEWIDTMELLLREKSEDKK